MVKVVDTLVLETNDFLVVGVQIPLSVRVGKVTQSVRVLVCHIKSYEFKPRLSRMVK